MPVRPANPRADVIFPGLLEAFEWNPTTELFDPVEVLEPGHAYWILVSGTADYGITGIPVTQVEFDDIGPGWWTVGAPFDTGAGSGYEYTGPGFGVTYSYDDITEEYSDTNILYKGVIKTFQKPKFVGHEKVATSNLKYPKSLIGGTISKKPTQVDLKEQKQFIKKPITSTQLQESGTYTKPLQKPEIKKVEPKPLGTELDFLEAE